MEFLANNAPPAWFKAKQRRQQREEARRRRWRVVVVGAGPAGLTAALHLKASRLWCAMHAVHLEKQSVRTEAVLEWLRASLQVCMQLKLLLLLLWWWGLSCFALLFDSQGRFPLVAACALTPLPTAAFGALAASRCSATVLM